MSVMALYTSGPRILPRKCDIGFHLSLQEDKFVSLTRVLWGPRGANKQSYMHQDSLTLKLREVKQVHTGVGEDGKVCH